MQATCQVSLEAIAHNYEYFRQLVKPAKIIPVVKANAYGHGAVEVTQHLISHSGVNEFAVATLEEALELAPTFPDVSFLIFSRVFASDLSRVPKNVILTLVSPEDAEAITSSVATAQRVHLNVNTGMNRLGLSPGEALDLLKRGPSNLHIEGIYSHFSSSDAMTRTVYRGQISSFRSFVDACRQAGFAGQFHLSNSAAVLQGDDNIFDAVRLGIGLYGYDTSPEQSHKSNLTPAMTIQAPLIRVAALKIGETVSYGETWCAQMDGYVGTLRIGYADGYPRALSNRGTVSLGEKTYPVIGTVTMDHIMIDLGKDSPTSGAMFTIMGGSHSAVGIQSIAHSLDTIPYELCCGISPRLARIYPD